MSTTPPSDEPSEEPPKRKRRGPYKTKLRRALERQQAELDRLRESNRRLAALKPVFERLFALMSESGPGPIRNYCTYIVHYGGTKALFNYDEVAPQLAPEHRKKLAEMDAEDPYKAELFASLHDRGVADAMAGKPPEPPPEGFPADLLHDLDVAAGA